MFHFVFCYTSVYLCFQKRISDLLKNLFSSEKRVDYAAAVEGSSSSSSSLVVPEQSSRSSSVAVTERTDISMLRGCCSSSNLTSVLSSQSIRTMYASSCK